MGHKLIEIEHCIFNRKEAGDPAFPLGVVQVLDEEGEELFLFPPVLADAEIKNILREINYAYDKGYENGSSSRARTICHALGIRPEALKNDE